MPWSSPKTYTVGELLTAADMNLYQRDNLEAGFPYGTTTQTYTPQLTAATTNPTLGSGSTQAGRYYRVGRWAFVSVIVVFGTSGTAAGSGTYLVSVPISIRAGSISTSVGSGAIFEDGVGRYVVSAVQSGSSNVLMVYNAPAATNNVTESAPFAWGANDSIKLDLAYEAA